MPAKPKTSRLSTAAAAPAIPVPEDKAQLAALLDRIVSAQTLMETTIAERDRALLNTGAAYNVQIDGFATLIDEGKEAARLWAVAHSSEFAGARSITVGGHAIGFRLGQPTVCAKSGWNAARILAALREKAGEYLTRVIRTKDEVNKDGVISLREDPEAVAMLRTCGLGVKQADRFYIDPNRAGQEDKFLTIDTAA